MRAKTLLSMSFVLTFTGCAGQVGGPEEVGEGLSKCASGPVVYGVDVSGYQGSSINWGAVKAAGRVFGFAKASEGTGFTDSSFAHNWAGMRGAGVLRGAYHFFRPGTDGTAQADHFVDVIDANGGLGAGDLPPVADVEVDDGVSASTVIARLHDFLDRVQARTGRKPLIYTANFFWGGTLGNPSFASYPLWVANYGPSCPYLPNAFTEWKFWQYTDKAQVSGIPGGVDGDEFNGTLAELIAWAGGSGGSRASGMFQTSRRAANNADGRLELFARAVGNAIFHDWQTSANGSWSGWASLGGQAVENPVVGANADGRLEAFVIVNGHLYTTFQLVGGGWYQGWLDLGDGNLVGEPAVALNSNGSMEVFARSSSGALEHVWQDSANGSFGSWASLGGVLHSDPGVGRNGDGRLEVFVLGADDRLYHDWQTAPHAGWSGWSGFGGITLKDRPAPGANADGRLEVFVTGTDARLHHIAQLPGGGWSGWLDAGSFAVQGAPAMSRNGDGRMEVFSRGTDNQLWHIWQSAANGGWSAGGAFAGTHLTSDPDAAPNADGRLEAFWRGSSGALESVVQLPGGGWSQVVGFGGMLASF